MKFVQAFAVGRLDVLKTVKWEKRTSEILDKDGSVVFRAENVEVPSTWSQLATDILASRYLRRAGVPKHTTIVKEDGVPDWLCRSVPVEGTETSCETSAKQAILRIVGCWTYWGWKKDYFDDEGSAWSFYTDLIYMLLHQMAAPNSPQWFNTGLHWAYGIEGSGQGLWFADDTGDSAVMPNEYERPLIHACFIQSVDDNLVKPGGIMDLWMREARLFKYGAGTGTNPSTLRGKGEPLSSGGISSGLMSWLKIGNVVAGSIKSGGTTRRAAKMLSLDISHPDIIEFIRWKAREELKVHALVAGAPMLDPGRLKLAKEYGLVLDFDFNGEAYETVDGQNGNLSIQIPDKFFDEMELDGVWEITSRTTDSEGHASVMRTIPSKELWDEICKAAWWSGDPGVQYYTTINEWHTCPEDGPIIASNPCSEYMFLENTACNLASLNLLKFKAHDVPGFNIAGFTAAVRLLTTVLDISIELASLPSKEIAVGTRKYRTLGLGYANLGALIMQYGLPYDSPVSHAICASITSLMTAVAYKTSSELAHELGAFPRFEPNRYNVLRVLRNHARISILDGDIIPRVFKGSEFEGLSIEPLTWAERRELLTASSSVKSPALDVLDRISLEGRDVWISALEGARDFGVRNAQTTLLAPTGTIGLLMDCDTTGLEPDFALVKVKKLSGGGQVRIVNQSVEPALTELGYSPDDISSIVESIREHGHIENSLISESDLPVFDCSGKIGDRVLSPQSHLNMMAAAQPLLSGAISKTVNLPTKASIDDVSDVYTYGHGIGLKAIALYRDGCKRSQPLNAEEKKEVVEPTEKIPMSPAARRERLPDTRDSVTHKFSIGGHEGYFTLGLYPDGRPGELFVMMSKEGSTVGGMMDSFATAVSICLQSRVPIESLVRKFSHQRFEPSGFTSNPNIPIAKSIVDYIFRWIGMRFIEGYREENRPGGTTVQDPPKSEKVKPETISDHAKQIQSDAPVCEKCGAITYRSGFCYKCLNCGHQPGCG